MNQKHDLIASLRRQLQSSISFLCFGEYLYISVGSAKIRSSNGSFSGAFFEFVKKFKKQVSPSSQIRFTNSLWDSMSPCFSVGMITNFIRPMEPATLKSSVLLPFARPAFVTSRGQVAKKTVNKIFVKFIARLTRL